MILNHSVTGTGGTYCFNLFTVPCNISNACCRTELYKIALPVRESKGKGEEME